MTLSTRTDPLLGRGLDQNTSFLGKGLFQPPPSTARAVSFTALNTGALSEGKGKGAVVVSATNQIVSQLAQETLVSFCTIRESVEDFKKGVELANKSLDHYITNFMTCISVDAQAGDVETAKAVIQLAKELVSYHYCIATQTIQLCDQQSIAASEICKRSLANIFDSRKQQIEMFASALEVAKRADLHEIELQEKCLDLVLRREKQLFEQMFEVTKHHQEVHEAENKHKLESTVEANRYALEERKLTLSHEVKELEIKAEKHARELTAEVDIQKATIAAETQRRKDGFEHEVKMAQIGNDTIGVLADSVVKVAGAAAVCGVM